MDCQICMQKIKDLYQDSMPIGETLTVNGDTPINDNRAHCECVYDINQISLKYVSEYDEGKISEDTKAIQRLEYAILELPADMVPMFSYLIAGIREIYVE